MPAMNDHDDLAVQLRRCREELAAVTEGRRESESLFGAIVEATPMGIHTYRLEPDGRLVFTGANPAADAILGVDNRQFVGQTVEEAFPSLVGTDLPASYRGVCLSGEPWQSEQITYADERIHGVFEVRAFRTAPATLAVLFLDVTERKRAERSLRESEEKYRLLVENAGDGIFIAQDGKIGFANRRAAELVGWDDPEELNGRSFLDFVAAEDWELVRDRHVRRLRGEDVPSTYPLRLQRQDGTTFWSQLSSVVLTWGGRPATLNFIRDISAQREMEVQLYLSERMRSIGTLAGGIAHDFNNILMGIQGSASLLLQRLGPEHPCVEEVMNIEQCVESGAELTRRILGFAQAGKYQVVPTDLNGLVRGTAQMFGRAKKEITVHGSYQEDLRVIEIDRTQMEQVLLNLFVNAWQAMPGGGELFLETRNVTLDEARAAVCQLKPGPYVSISVRDTGCGMSPEVLDRVFDPFFSTRTKGRGTGLGLASVYGIVRNHGGHIGVASAPGSGSTFTILLPASDRALVPQEAPPLSGAVVRGRGTVLLVDDETPVLTVGQRMLEALGYEVLTAESGAAALALLLERRGRVVAVVLDMIMPGLSGGETYDRLRQLDPGVKVLLSSGYNLDGEARQILARGCDDFIQKPYTLAALSLKLGHLLGSA